MVRRGQAGETGGVFKSSTAPSGRGTESRRFNIYPLKMVDV